ncbi:hypothetical protein [Paracoccus salsus]|uniref:hypothetical protein n=1 Tax=Paracoccus salsus TaxID=2911061 RepID=UPI001F2379F6|nr:hypothetical protein [Paracoccus salsus]
MASRTWPSAGLSGAERSLTSLSPAIRDAAASTSFPQLFVRPENPVMWALLLSLFVLLAMDAAGQWTDPSRSQDMQVWWLLSFALLVCSVWPWLMGHADVAATIGAIAAAMAAIAAAIRTVGQSRPAIGFFAGWLTGLAAATLATLLGTWAALPDGQIAILSILPAAMVGVALQRRLGRAFAYSVAITWGFCGLAVSTMGNTPISALAAILGITAMAAALIRAAS